MPKLCVLTECVTQRSSGLLLTKVCQVSPSLNVANVQLVPIGSQQAVGEGALCPALPGGQLAHLGPQRHEVNIPTGTPWAEATQNTLCQLEHLCHQQHEKPSGQIGLMQVKLFYKLLGRVILF